jgi:mono/diheme cytochrome c family protein
MKYLLSLVIVLEFAGFSLPSKNSTVTGLLLPDNPVFRTTNKVFDQSNLQSAESEHGSPAPTVTPVVGPSWLKHLGVHDLDRTAMGQMGGNQPPLSSERVEPNLLAGNNSPRKSLNSIIDKILSVFRKNTKESSRLMDESFVLTGADLYRLNCQSCHGPGGVGAPPEVTSLVGPVQGTSPSMIEERMRRIGRPISSAMAHDLAAGADSTIRERFQNGGERMPPFRHLRGDEVDALMMYLKELSGVPSAEIKNILVTQSVERVGEHVVKGTCHTCHDATGPGGGRTAMMNGIVPSLASFTSEYSVQQIVRQVELGSSGMMRMMGGTSMPAMPYITRQEAVAAYLYLLEYPPRP